MALPQAEVDWLLRIGGIEVESGHRLNDTTTLYSLQKAP